MKLKLLSIVLAGALTCPQIAFAENPAVKQLASLPDLLEGFRGKRVTVRLQGGEELTGTVKRVSHELLHLEELSRREFYDAHIAVPKIEAVIVRAREK